MLYYRICTGFDKGYAYSNYEKDRKTLYDYYGNFDHHDNCPLCGSLLGGPPEMPPYRIFLSTKKLGDFIFGSFHPFIVSRNFKDKYEKSGLTGIKEFHKMDRIRFRKEIFDLDYYWIMPERVNVRPEPIEAVLDNTSRPICELCNPYGKYCLKYKGLKMNLNGLEKTPDIFLTYINCMGIYCTQRLVDFCHENKFTNFDSHINLFKDDSLLW